jgi:hypothetical protein
MQGHTATEHPQQSLPLGMTIGLGCIFLAVSGVRVLDNGIGRLGWTADLCFAIVFFSVGGAYRHAEEQWRARWTRPRMIVAILFMSLGVAAWVAFDMRHFYADFFPK